MEPGQRRIPRTGSAETLNTGRTRHDGRARSLFAIRVRLFSFLADPLISCSALLWELFSAATVLSCFLHFFQACARLPCVLTRKPKRASEDHEKNGAAANPDL